MKNRSVLFLILCELLIFKNLHGKKQLRLYQNAGHENILEEYRNEWRNEIVSFTK